MDRSSTQHDISVDVLRGLAALSVVFYHYSELTTVFRDLPFIGGIAFLGMFGVDLFYVISGYLITTSILRPSGWSAIRFAVKRIRRIVPAYYVSIVVVVLISFAMGGGVEHIFSVRFLKDVLSHLLFIHNTATDTHGSINGVYWTLGGLKHVSRSCSVPTVVVQDVGYGYLVVFCWIVIALIWRYGVFIFGPTDNLWLRYFAATQLPGSIDGFGVGALVALLRFHGVGFVWRGGAIWRCAYVAVTVFLLAVTLRYFLAHSGSYWVSFYPAVVWRLGLSAVLGMVLLAFLWIPKHGFLERLFSAAGLSWVGRVSYSVYLYHLPVILYFSWLSTKFSMLASPGLMFAFSLLSLLLVSGISYRFVESPMLRSPRSE
ncbi:MAG: acyltransferase [Uliginosibacterium sp.]|nr:acyltransferase [Uliginosibacterium sp.]